MARDGYKDTVRDPATGRRRELRDADYTIRGDVEVTGALTENGIPISGADPAALISADADNALVEGTDDKLFVPEAGGGVALETPTGAVNGTNDDFVFTAPPVVVFRNGVNETRLGTIATNTFTFDTPPETGDDIEGLV